MKLEWRIDAGDVSRVQALVDGQSSNALIRARKERFWRAMFASPADLYLGKIVRCVSPPAL
jgi:hypothetical protein